MCEKRQKFEAEADKKKKNLNKQGIYLKFDSRFKTSLSIRK